MTYLYPLVTPANMLIRCFANVPTKALWMRFSELHWIIIESSFFSMATTLLYLGSSKLRESWPFGPLIVTLRPLISTSIPCGILTLRSTIHNTLVNIAKKPSTKALLGCFLLRHHAFWRRHY